MSPAEHPERAPVTLRGVTPVLRITDLGASLRYYTDVLGFRIDWQDNDGSSFASVSRDRCNLFLSVGDQGNPGSWMWIGASDVDALHEELTARGARVRQPPANYPWGSREMHVEDLDGNVLRFGSENKAGEPFGDWLDMRGIRWRHRAEGGWIRVDE